MDTFCLPHAFPSSQWHFSHWGSCHVWFYLTNRVFISDIWRVSEAKTTHSESSAVHTLLHRHGDRKHSNIGGTCKDNIHGFVVHYVMFILKKGLQAIKVFINSLGRFGNAPFLFPIFGGGELPQAFCRYCYITWLSVQCHMMVTWPCRLCAVFGGIYCLHRHVTSLVTTTTDDSITSVICSSGQKIKCS